MHRSIQFKHNVDVLDYVVLQLLLVRNLSPWPLVHITVVVLHISKCIKGIVECVHIYIPQHIIITL